MDRDWGEPPVNKFSDNRLQVGGGQPLQFDVSDPRLPVMLIPIDTLCQRSLPQADRGVNFILSVTTGLRPSELRALTWDDITLDGEEPFVRVNKSLHKLRKAKNSIEKAPHVEQATKTISSERDVPLLDVAVEAMLRHRDKMEDERHRYEGRGGTWSRPDLVFTTTQGNPLQASNVSGKFWKRLIGRAGLDDMPLYSLRRSFVTHSIELGVDLKTTSVLVGHSDIGETANTYKQVTGQSVQGARGKLNQAWGQHLNQQPKPGGTQEDGREWLH